VFTSGCAMTQQDKSLSSNSSTLEPQAMIKFSDVPVPSGFKSLPAQSYTFESSGVRVGVLKFQGKAEPDQIVNFYKEQMPMYNWNLLNVVEYGDRLLNFDRENETCVITLLTKGKTVIITVSLGPKSQVTAKKTKKEPVK
jgi:hypothetical protein